MQPYNSEQDMQQAKVVQNCLPVNIHSHHYVLAMLCMTRLKTRYIVHSTQSAERLAGSANGCFPMLLCACRQDQFPYAAADSAVLAKDFARRFTPCYSTCTSQSGGWFAEHLARGKQVAISVVISPSLLLIASFW